MCECDSEVCRIFYGAVSQAPCWRFSSAPIEIGMDFPKLVGTKRWHIVQLN